MTLDELIPKYKESKKKQDQLYLEYSNHVLASKKAYRLHIDSSAMTRELKEKIFELSIAEKKEAINEPL